MHMALHAIPLLVAVNFGDSSSYLEEKIQRLNMVERHQIKECFLPVRLKKFGVTNGTTAEDWYDDELTEELMRPYYWPTEEEQSARDVGAIFLGHFFQWDPRGTYEVASAHGFEAGEVPKTGYYNFADIGNEFLITVHHWMKWYKFGFSRLWDNLSIGSGIIDSQRRGH